jgi:hypothetical protein
MRVPAGIAAAYQAVIGGDTIRRPTRVEARCPTQSPTALTCQVCSHSRNTRFFEQHARLEKLVIRAPLGGRSKKTVGRLRGGEPFMSPDMSDIWTIPSADCLLRRRINYPKSRATGSARDRWGGFLFGALAEINVA